jgi:hypothetical protein
VTGSKTAEAWLREMTHSNKSLQNAAVEAWDFFKEKP